MKKGSQRFAKHLRHEMNDDYFCGTYKQHLVSVEREPTGNYYIRVQNANGLYAYDGFWGDIYVLAEMDDAIEEALHGACLLAEKEGK